MANMGYCRFENTCGDLEDCIDHMDDPDLSEREKKYRSRIIDLAHEIVEDYGNQEE